ncbi:MAG TPA: MtrB/PioB family outer membrane beta-barrel protein [Thermoanaerobaculia bacterium]
MKQTILALLLAVPLLAQQEPVSTETPVSEAVVHTIDAPATGPEKIESLFSNVVSIDAQGATVDTDSSKFEEYRDVPRGIAGPDFRFFGESAASQILVTGENLVQEDRRIVLSAETPIAGIDAFYDVIPHRLGNNARSIHTPVSATAWGISDLAQRSLQTQLEAQFAANRTGINYTFLRRLVEPLVNTPYLFDLGYTRERVGLSLNIFPTGTVDTRVSFFQENREGNRNAGTSFGFGNVVETAEPIDYITRDFGIRLEQPFARGLIRGGLTVNQFLNEHTSYTFDNPFRAVDSTDPSAYQAPGSASINGASFARMALAPDSTHAVASIGAIYKLPRNSRITADVGYGMLQSSSTLIPYTTNSAIVMPELPMRHYDGEIATSSVNLQFTSRPLRNVRFNARYRFYDVDNQSDRVHFPGYVRFDASLEPTPRVTVPYGWSTQTAEVSGAYDLGRFATLELGFRNNTMERTFRETRETTENMFRIAADFRPLTWMVARTSYELGSRDYDEYDQVRAESASFDEPEQVNLPGLRRFDQARRDSHRVVAMVQATPFDGPVNVGVNFVRYFDDYDESEFGLRHWRTQALNAEVDYTPSPRWNVFGFFGTDVWGGFQQARQSGATFSTNPLDNWSAYNTDKSKTFGVGANFTIIPERFDVRVSSQLQTVNGRAQLESPPGGTPDLAFDVLHVDDTRFLQTFAQLTYRISEAWELALGAWIEDYDIDDDQSSGTQPYMPASFFLVPEDGDYQGNIAYVRTRYRW